jgi:hypothetical protein
MTDATLNTPTPQFGTAEYAGPDGNDHCLFCHQPITGTYYRVNESLACPGCAEKARGELAKDTHPAYVRALLFGLGAAIAGMILYATFAITTGLVIGYVSLAVGWMVGTAMTKGSGGVGGRRYQVAAAVLTYAAVSMAAVPIWIHYAREHRPAHTQKITKQTPQEEEFNRQERAANPNANVNSTTSDSRADSASSSASATNSARPRSSRPAALAKLALLGIASPLFEVWQTGPSVSWAIGIVILIVGIRIAWRITAGKPLEIFGPFENSQPVR